MSDVRDVLTRDLLGHEGEVLRAYDDATGRVVNPGDTVKGWLTIGVGRNLVGRGITQAESRYLLANDIAAVDAELDAQLPLWRSWSPAYDASEDIAHLRSAVPDRAHAKAVVSYYRALLGAGVRPALADPVRPLLVLHGGDDRCLEPGLARLAGATVVPGAGHFLQLEQPAAVAEAVLGFTALA